MPDMKLSEVMELMPDNVVVIDTETTGLEPGSDEVLSLSIVKASGDVLFDHLIKPKTRKRWPNAQEIHGIKPSDVKDEKTLDEYEDDLAKFFSGDFLVVGYNVSFDLKMLEANGLDVSACKSFDVMREFEKKYGCRVKLAECAKNYGYGPFSAHGSLEDAKATAYCFSRLLNDDEYVKIRELEDSGVQDDSARIIAAQQTSSSGYSLPILALAVFILVFIVIVLVVI